MSHALLPKAEVCQNTIRLINNFKNQDEGDLIKAEILSHLKRGFSLKIQNQDSQKGNKTLVKAECCATIKGLKQVQLCLNSLDPLLDRLSSTLPYFIIFQ